MSTEARILRAILTSFLTLIVAAAAPDYLLTKGEAKQAKDSADPVKKAILSPATRIVRVPVSTRDDRDTLYKIGNVVHDHDAFIEVAIDDKALGKLPFRYTSLERTISLPGAVFDPLLAPSKDGTARESLGGDGRGYYIVQFGGTVTDEWLDEVRSEGLEIIQYVPHQAFIVYGSASAAEASKSNSRVRWVGKYLPDQKISAEIRKLIDTVKSGKRNFSLSTRRAFDIAVFAREDLNTAAKEIATASGGEIMAAFTVSNAFFNVVRLSMPVEAVAKVAGNESVFRIDPYIQPEIEDERAPQIVAGNYSSTTSIFGPGYSPQTQFGATGFNVTVAVADDGISIPGVGGFYLTSANTVNGPLRGATTGASGGHGHLNASIIAGSTPFGPLDPLNYNYGLGIAPDANIINLPFLKSGSTATDAQTANDAVTVSGTNLVKGSISNNSWGAGTNANAYDSLSATYDSFTRDASTAGTIDPLLFVFSAGNSGPGAATLTRPKTAKNIIVVGNSENVRTELGGTNADNIDDLRASSSRGPTADGRIKPDVTAPGSYITGGRAGNCSSITSCFETNHVYSIGTSHAAPQVAGAAAIFTQYWKDTHVGQNPSPALMKAAILNSSVEMNGLITSGSTIPNGNEGWGRINMSNMFNVGSPIRYVNETDIFSSPGESTNYIGSVVDPSLPVRVTLVWTDPPAAADPALVNDLDLTVTVGANVYRGNVFSGGVSVTGGANSTIDNVENVFLPSGTAAGTPVSITVSASALNGDGVLGNADLTDQHYALVIYNATLGTTAANADITGRIVDAFGRGIPRTVVRLAGSKATAFAVTNTFGYYRFVNVGVGDSYVLTPSNKRYDFAPENRVLELIDSIDDQDFVATSR